MAETHYPVELDVSQIGHIAQRMIVGAGRTRIAAVFKNSFYIAIAGSWVCVIGPAHSMSALALRCTTTRQVDWGACGLRQGMNASAGEAYIYVPPLFRFRIAGASTWTPPAVPPWTLESLQRGMQFLFDWMRTNPVADAGLGRIILCGEDKSPADTVAKRAFEAVVKLRCWLRGTAVDGYDAAAAPGRAVERLIGLGPGLTPSGDDFLGGMLVGLRMTGRLTAAAKLFDAISASSTHPSNPVSASHLQAAASGACSEGIHAAINAILAGDAESLPSKLDAMNRIGHTSGWDTLAGATTVLSTWTQRDFTASEMYLHQPTPQATPCYRPYDHSRVSWSSESMLPYLQTN